MHIWCNKVSEYFQHEPPVPAVKTENCDANPVNCKRSHSDDETPAKCVKAEPDPPPVETNYDAETDVDIDNLLDHAVNLVQEAKKELSNDAPTLPVRQPKKKWKKSMSTSHVETTKAALDNLHAQTLDKLSPVGNAPEPTKREWCIKCRLCTKTFTTIHDLNNHHREEHGIVGCTQCDKKFSNQTSLDKHMYVHEDMKHICDACGKKFPFESRLVQHSIVHINQCHSYTVKSCKNHVGIQGNRRSKQTH